MFLEDELDGLLILDPLNPRKMDTTGDAQVKEEEEEEEEERARLQEEKENEEKLRLEKGLGAKKKFKFDLSLAELTNEEKARREVERDGEQMGDHSDSDLDSADDSGDEVLTGAQEFSSWTSFDNGMPTKEELYYREAVQQHEIKALETISKINGTKNEMRRKRKDNPRGYDNDSEDEEINYMGNASMGAIFGEGVTALWNNESRAMARRKSKKLAEKKIQLQQMQQTQEEEEQRLRDSALAMFSDIPMDTSYPTDTDPTWQGQSSQASGATDGATGVANPNQTNQTNSASAATALAASSSSSGGGGSQMDQLDLDNRPQPVPVPGQAPRRAPGSGKASIHDKELTQEELKAVSGNMYGPGRDNNDTMRRKAKAARRAELGLGPRNMKEEQFQNSHMGLAAGTFGAMQNPLAKRNELTGLQAQLFSKAQMYFVEGKEAYALANLDELVTQVPAFGAGHQLMAVSLNESKWLAITLYCLLYFIVF